MRTETDILPARVALLPAREGEAGDRFAAGTLRPGLRVYAIGDIHGHLETFARLLRLIEVDRQARPVAEAVIVCLGDYVDRGPESAGVVRRLRRGMPAGFRHMMLRGNHEQLMVDAGRGDWAAWFSWLGNGGDRTLTSYGIGGAEQAAWQRDRPPLADCMRSACGDDIDWLAALPSLVVVDGYVFAHAGLRPGVPIAEQLERDLLWIRRDFTGVSHDFGHVVVHGHTPAFPAQDLPHRICVDTGVYVTGVLTAVVLEDDGRRFLQARA